LLVVWSITESISITADDEEVEDEEDQFFGWDEEEGEDEQEEIFNAEAQALFSALSATCDPNTSSGGGGCYYPLQGCYDGANSTTVEISVNVNCNGGGGGGGGLYGEDCTERSSSSDDDNDGANASFYVYTQDDDDDGNTDDRFCGGGGAGVTGEQDFSNHYQLQDQDDHHHHGPYHLPPPHQLDHDVGDDPEFQEFLHTFNSMGLSNPMDNEGGGHHSRSRTRRSNVGRGGPGGPSNGGYESTPSFM